MGVGVGVGEVVGVVGVDSPGDIDISLHLDSFFSQFPCFEGIFQQMTMIDVSRTMKSLTQGGMGPYEKDAREPKVVTLFDEERMSQCSGVDSHLSKGDGVGDTVDGMGRLKGWVD